MAITTTSVASFVNNQINAYRGLAQKATGTDETVDQNNSVVAALKQFFYKLDFLLKYGHFPSVEDTENTLPKELRELKTFLENPQNAGERYILQKDVNTRYCFTYADIGTITVAEESRSWEQDRGNTPGKLGAWTESGEYVWQEVLSSQSCNPNDLLVGLGLKQPVDTVTEQPVDTVTELFRSKLDNYVKHWFEKNRVSLSRLYADFAIKTEITTNDGEPVLRFSFEIDNNGFRDSITHTFKNQREMIYALSGVCCYPPFTYIVSNGENKSTLLAHILEKAVQAGISLQGINLQGANLVHAILKGADMEDAILKGANMEYADMAGANMKGANMKSAHVKGANWKEAHRVNLEGAYMN